MLWRHGQTAWNAEARFQGHADVPLDEVGHAQAAAALPLLAAEGAQAVLSSDLGRAVQTAAPLADRLGLPLRTDPRLRETGLGRWEGRTVAEVEATWPEEIAAWRAGAVVRRGSGETRPEVARRLLAAVADIDVESAVLVGHGSSSKALTLALLGLLDHGWQLLAPLGNCHWSTLVRLPGGWRLEAHNVGVPDPVPSAAGHPAAAAGRVAPAAVDAGEPVAR